MIGRIRTILVFICLTVYFFVALYILLGMWPQFADSRLGDVVLGIPPFAQRIVLLLSMAAVLAIAGLTVRELRDKIYVTKAGEEGSVTIVESAITRYIRQVAMDMPSVQTVRSVITNTREGLVVDLYTRVLVTETLPRIEQAVRRRVREALEETLGVGGVAAINVVIENFQKAPPPEGEAADETAAAEAAGAVAVPVEETGAKWTPLFRRTPEETAQPEEVPEEERPAPAGPETAPEVLGPDGEAETTEPESAPETTTEDEDVEDKPGAQTPDEKSTERRD